VDEMRKHCPNCESLDVQLNEKGQLVCFTCFNIFSSDSLMDRHASPELPPFPEELERRTNKRKESRVRKSDDDDHTSPYRRVVA
jgi:uncharacterized Zn finger protein (UPF0148 family)